MALYKEEFTALGDIVYLNHASYGPRPISAYKAMDTFCRNMTNGSHAFGDTYEVVGDCKELIGKLVNVSPEYVSLSGNTSMGLNYIAASYPFRERDEVLIIDRQFPTAVHPWLNQQQRGVKCSFVPADPYPDLERALSMINKHTRFVVVSWIRFFDGYRVNLKEWTDAVHEYGAYLVVDGMQGCGAIPLNLTETGVDAFSAGGAKWLLSPLATGFLYVAEELRDELKPVFAGWLQMLDDLDFESSFDYNWRIPPDGRRFEVATYPFALLYGMREALRILVDADPVNIAPHIFSLLDRLISQIEGINGFKIISCMDDEVRSGILSIETPEGSEIVERLGAEEIKVSFREGGLRISPHLYNTRENIDTLVKSII
ncbi:MAG: aminotransferase class V-fold PLP-dependent enzyme [bacterium]|nr:aminotransferase class V-fold PLP-dependent enzyme [bacterium]